MAPECLKLPHLKLARKNAYDSLLISRSTFTDLSITYMLTIKLTFDQWNYCKKFMQSSN